MRALRPEELHGLARRLGPARLQQRRVPRRVLRRDPAALRNCGIHEVDTVCDPPPLAPFRKLARAPIATAAAEFAAAAEQPDFRSQSRRAKASWEEANRSIRERRLEESRAANTVALECYGERQVERGAQPSYVARLIECFREHRVQAGIDPLDVDDVCEYHWWLVDCSAVKPDTDDGTFESYYQDGDS
eukprot:7382053-Prymnesium_polylepis.1